MGCCCGCECLFVWVSQGVSVFVCVSEFVSVCVFVSVDVGL